MEKIFSNILFLISIVLFAQVGVNTTEPLGVFHVDIEGNNPNDVVNSNPFYHLDDFIILPNGNVGIGTLFPKSKLEIISSVNPAFRLVDGSQGKGKTLISSTDGNAQWKYFGLEIYHGVFSRGRAFELSNINNSNFNFDSNNPTSNFYGTGSYIDLPPGKWLVTLNLETQYYTVLEYGQVGVPISKDDWVWIRYSFSDESGYSSLENSINVSITTDFADKNNIMAGGGISGPNGNTTSPAKFGPVHGQFILYNQTNSLKRYYLIAGAISSSKNNLSGYLVGGSYNIGSSILAIPIQL